MSPTNATKNATKNATQSKARVTPISALRQTVNSYLHTSLRWDWIAALATTVAMATTTQVAFAQSADEHEVLRVDIPLTQTSYRGGELAISQLITDNTYIDVEEFNLRAVEIEAFTPDNGEVRLKVGRYVTPPVPLPPGQTASSADYVAPGLLRIEAPHKTNDTWRLLIDQRVNITALTAVLEPRSDNVAYYESRYQQRGYAFGSDPYYRQDWRNRSLRDSWLGADYDYNRQASHWLWLNDSRARYNLNPSYGHSHRHSRDCYDRFGRHLAFGSSLRGNAFDTRRRTYLHQRSLQTLRSNQNDSAAAARRRSADLNRAEQRRQQLSREGQRRREGARRREGQRSREQVQQRGQRPQPRQSRERVQQRSQQRSQHQLRRADRSRTAQQGARSHQRE